jgi:hypothetical protein
MRHRLPEAQLAILDEARKAVERAAKRQGVILTEHAAVIARVREVTAHVREALERANQSGDLAWFNSLYREWRMKAKGLGMGMPYEQALASLRLAIYRRAAAGGAISVDATLASEVFPKLKSTARAQ